MKLYVLKGKVFANFDETIELCDLSGMDTLQKYKEELLKKIADRFDWIVTEAALKGMEETKGKSLPIPKELPKIEIKQNESISEPKKQRNRIDIGKIMALKNAGWSNVKIADEMGMQPQSVASAIYQYKKKCEARE